MITFEDQAPGFSEALLQGWSFVESVKELHDELTSKFTDHVLKTGPSFSALVAAQITRHAVELLHGIEVLSRAQENRMAHMNLRPVEENISNLFYILYAGPIVDQVSVDKLAEQFLAYRKIEHDKFVSQFRSEFERKLRIGIIPPLNSKICDINQLKIHADIVAREATKLRQEFPLLGKHSWHKTNKKERSRHVLKHLPFHAEDLRLMWGSEFQMTSLQDSLLHASPALFSSDPAIFSHRDSLTISKTTVSGQNWSSCAALYAIHCWYALGELLGEYQTVRDTFESIKLRNGISLFDEMKVPMMWEIK
jgi:hypothetical protein